MIINEIFQSWRESTRLITKDEIKKILLLTINNFLQTSKDFFTSMSAFWFLIFVGICGSLSNNIAVFSAHGSCAKPQYLIFALQILSIIPLVFILMMNFVAYARPSREIKSRAAIRQLLKKRYSIIIFFMLPIISILYPILQSLAIQIVPLAFATCGALHFARIIVSRRQTQSTNYSLNDPASIIRAIGDKPYKAFFIMLFSFCILLPIFLALNVILALSIALMPPFLLPLFFYLDSERDLYCGIRSIIDSFTMIIYHFPYILAMSMLITVLILVPTSVCCGIIYVLSIRMQAAPNILLLSLPTWWGQGVIIGIWLELLTFIYISYSATLYTKLKYLRFSLFNNEPS